MSGDYKVLRNVQIFIKKHKTTVQKYFISSEGHELKSLLNSKVNDTIKLYLKRI